jgi:ABC-2 type transport system permease protein
MSVELALSDRRGLSSVWSRTLRDQRRALVWWAVGLLATVLVTVAFWPTIQANAEQFTQFLENLPASLRDLFGVSDFVTPAGYLQARLFSFLGPILMLVLAIGAGARAIAGEEEAGTLDLLLTTPIRRRDVVVQKFVAMLIAVAIIIAVTWVSLAALGPRFDLAVPADGLAAACLNLFLLALAFGTIALAIGSATGSKGLATGASSGVALLTYLLRSFAPSVDWLEPFRVLSPFYYYIDHDPLLQGVNAGDVVVLTAVTVVALVIALVTFERRDLAT